MKQCSCPSTTIVSQLLDFGNIEFNEQLCPCSTRSPSSMCIWKCWPFNLTVSNRYELEFSFHCQRLCQLHDPYGMQSKSISEKTKRPFSSRIPGNDRSLILSFLYCLLDRVMTKIATLIRTCSCPSTGLYHLCSSPSFT